MKDANKSNILIKGAKVNNLKDIDVEIPRDKLVVVTGLSGSGKSSLAFDTLYAEGQRRYVESLSSYARQFMGRMSKPQVDYILGVAPAIAIQQKVNTSNPRSTVGTSTEIYEYLKLLFARIGRTFSPISGVEVKRHSVTDVVDFIVGQPDETKIMILAPLAVTPERPLKGQLEILHQEGFMRISIAGTIVRIEDFLPSCNDKEHYADPMLLVDRVTVHPDDDNQLARLGESVQTAFFEGRGSCRIAIMGDDGTQYHDFSNSFEADGIVFEKPNPNFFSFNNPYGACPTCGGYGSVIGIDEHIVVPNRQLSVYDDAIACWKGEKMSEWKQHFIKHAFKINFPVHTPYCDLTEAEHDLLWHGDEEFPGIDGFFKWIESQSYKIQYRVMLARYRGKTTCPDCHGSRLRKDALYVKVCGKTIAELSNMAVKDLAVFLQDMHLTDYELKLTERIRTELHNRVGYLLDVGLGYLTLSRQSNTLSGGESQRINLATSLGSSLVGSMYILDEPSIGLHSRDTAQLISVLQRLRDLGNTVIVVEHDEEIIRAADYIIDIGPGAGRLGGEVVFEGNYAKMEKLRDDPNSAATTRSMTAQYLLGMRAIDLPTSRRKWRDRIVLHDINHHNLHHTDVEIPLGVLTVVTGVSGSGKTTLVKHVLYDILQKRFEDNPEYVGYCHSVTGDLSRISGVELVDQNPIGRSSRSNPATYIKAYDSIRQLYAMQPLAKNRGYKANYFSFNVEGGRCETCQGEGIVTIGMQFMADVHLVCDDCHGTRFQPETLEITYHNTNISEVLEMTIDQAIDFFDPAAAEADYKSACQQIVSRLNPLQDVGLGYLKLGQSSDSLSGGEAQRVKLASFLVKGSNRNPLLFIFDEPSTGLHFHDIQKLLIAFNTLVSNGHSIIVIEHHPDIIKQADWVIDMGPEGGDGGGQVVYAGTPEGLLDCPDSYTGKYMEDKLKKPTTKAKKKQQ
ncbi:MAG: excinuclease ABC subunit UvrA [Bacteroidales bacterium]|nr:excinuclease ABC subunit UvrA [Bacteroidales bacterium]